MSHYKFYVYILNIWKILFYLKNTDSMSLQNTSNPLIHGNFSFSKCVIPKRPLQDLFLTLSILLFLLFIYFLFNVLFPYLLNEYILCSLFLSNRFTCHCIIEFSYDKYKILKGMFLSKATIRVVQKKVSLL